MGRNSVEHPYKPYNLSAHNSEAVLPDQIHHQTHPINVNKTSKQSFIEFIRSSEDNIRSSKKYENKRRTSLFNSSNHGGNLTPSIHNSKSTEFLYEGKVLPPKPPSRFKRLKSIIRGQKKGKVYIYYS